MTLKRFCPVSPPKPEEAIKIADLIPTPFHQYTLKCNIACSYLSAENPEPEKAIEIADSMRYGGRGHRDTLEGLIGQHFLTKETPDPEKATEIANSMRNGMWEKYHLVKDIEEYNSNH